MACILLHQRCLQSGFCPLDVASPNTPKKDFPWVATTTYVSDWQAIKQKRLDVPLGGLAKAKHLELVATAQDCQNLSVVQFLDYSIPGLLKKAATRHFGESTLSKFLLSVKASPAQAKAAAAKETKSKEATKSNTNKEAEDQAKSDTEEIEFAGVAKKAKKSKRRSGLQALLDAQEKENDMTPGQLKAQKELEQKQKRDFDNNIPCPLFLMIIPSEVEGVYLFVYRWRYAALARNVLRGLVPFLVQHLNEPNDAFAYAVLNRWLSSTAIDRACRRKWVWCSQTGRAMIDQSRDDVVNKGMDWLESGKDITDAWKGTLSIDMEMAEAKYIDDGATDVGLMDDLNNARAQLDDALQELAEKDDEIAESEKCRKTAEQEKLAAKEQIHQALAKLEEMQNVFAAHGIARDAALTQSAESKAANSPGEESKTAEPPSTPASCVSDPVQPSKISFSPKVQVVEAPLQQPPATISDQPTTIAPIKVSKTDPPDPSLKSPPSLKTSCPDKSSPDQFLVGSDQYPPKPNASQPLENYIKRPVSPDIANASRGAADGATVG